MASLNVIGRPPVLTWNPRTCVEAMAARCATIYA
jgi:hypothetical protein